MAKNENQKLKLIYLLKILHEETDEKHGLSMTEILEMLKKYDIKAERKSIYSDMEALQHFGVDVICSKNDNKFRYCLASREFELAELKLLVDSVQSSKFITLKKSNELIKKLEGLTSRFEAKQLQRQVYVTERIKPLNEKIYYTVDKIHTGISQNVTISFQYFQWNEKKEPVLKKNGTRYNVSPWALTWVEDNYYLIAYDGIDRKIKHFRVDKMQKLELGINKREGINVYNSFNIGMYTRKMFGMFGGEEQRVRLLVRNDMAGVIIDRFGTEPLFTPEGDNYFSVSVVVSVSRQFLSWVISLGEGVKITGPQKVVSEMKKEIVRLNEMYS